MNMKIKNGFFEVNNVPDSTLNRLLSNRDVAVSISFALSKFLKLMTPINEAYVETKKQLVERLADKDKEGKPAVEGDVYSIKENLEEFNAEFKKLVEIESDIAMEVIQIHEGDIPKGLINAYEFAQLDGIIEYKEE